MITKDTIKYLMFKLGLRDTIPARIINNIEINENNEPLVDIRKDNTLFFDDKLKHKKEIFVRKTVYEKLKEAQKYLPKRYNFKIFSAYRSLDEQKISGVGKCVVTGITDIKGLPVEYSGYYVFVEVQGFPTLKVRR